MAKPTAPSSTVLQYLKDRPGEIISPSQIAEDTGLSASSVSAALQHLHRQNRGRLVNRSRGEWIWQEPVTIESNGGEPADAPASLSLVSVHSSGGLVYQDEDGGIWLAVPMLPAAASR